MSEADIHAFLEEEIITNGNSVTFRLLSRKLKIHVNEAKNGLATFYTKKHGSQQMVHATFWLSGETEQGDESNGDVTIWRATLVDEESLENAKATFKSITSLHIYALGPHALTDTSELCSSAKLIRDIDNIGGAALAETVGKITSQNITTLSFTKSSKKAISQKDPGPSKPSLANTPAKVKEEQSSTAVNEPMKVKPKQTGKLDWSKGKSKEPKKETTVPTQMKKPAAVKDVPSSASKDTGRKRKVSPLAEEIELPKPAEVKQETSEKARIKKGVVLSDDEDEQPIIKPAARKRQSKVVDDDLELEPSLKAMMDVDDSEVIKASKPTAPSMAAPEGSDEEPPPSEPAPEDSMAVDEESDDPAPKAKPRKRKEKKVMPVGRNGLKKKRVVKSKTEFDEKGYMVTVDYSSYESADEDGTDEKEVAKPKVATKPKAKPKKSAAREPISRNPAPSESESEKPTAPKPSPASNFAKKAAPPKAPPAKGRSSKGGQKSLNNFFSAKAKS